MVECHVKIPARQKGGYTITIGTGILSALFRRIETEYPERKPFVVTDRNIVTAGHLRTMLGEKDIPSFVISDPGETSKNLGTVQAILETMEKNRLGRDTIVLALGGGTVGDIAGFAASVFKRGVPVVQVPTTTVAQADSAIGGKTGVDSSLSKNAFGAFWHPAAVCIDVETLATLDDRQFRAGLVESLKHAIIADSRYFDFLEAGLDEILSREPNMLEKMALYNCTIKAAIVEKDPTEQNQRRMLNYGHTIGHAVETASNYQLLHGQALAIGIVAAAMIEIELGLGTIERLERIRRMLTRLSQPVALPPRINTQKLFELLSYDKKAVDKWPRFVLIGEIGCVHRRHRQYAVPVAQDIVKKILSNL
jgi:3-dehydroquinate synthase